MTPAAGSPGTASDGYRVDPPAGRHRAPPPVPTPRAPTVIAVAAAVLTAASLVAIAAAAVAPDATSICSPTPIQGDISCPPPAVVDVTGLALTRPTARPVTSTSVQSPTSIATVPDRADARTPRPSRGATASPSSRLPSTASGQPGSVQGSTPVLETTLTRESPSSPDVTPTEPTPTTPLADPIAAAESATPTSEEPAVTETPEPTASVTADVTAEVTP